MVKNSTPSVVVVERLFEVVKDRRGGDPKASNSARLFARGKGKICQKLGEEAVETIVAALDQSPAEVASESADLLYHLLILWAETGVEPADVWAELERREGVSGLDEKKNRTNKNA